MRAAVITRLGGPEVVEVQKVERPLLEEGTALIRTEATSVNWLDVLARTEDFGLPFPHIPGSDVVGIIEDIDSASSFRPGDRVVVNPGICTTERDRLYVRILGLHLPGGYGEVVRVPIEQLHIVPEHLSVKEAAAFPLTFLTAWRMLSTRARLQAGETLFIWGASGSLGSAAVQLAKYLGAHVIAAAGRDSFVESLQFLGADEVVLYKRENVQERVKALTNGRGVDVVFESVGKATWETSLQILAQAGRVVICGTTSGGTVTDDLTEIYYNQVTILGSRMGYPAEFKEVLDVIATARLRPAVAAVYELEKAAVAHERIEKRDAVGKIVLMHG